MAAAGSHLEISTDLARFGAFVERTAGLWVRLAGLESAYLKYDLAAIDIEAPVYVAGLARAGSTVLLELLAQHPDTGTHRYRDFPPIYTPVMWDWLQRRMPTKEVKPAERAHRDRILITPDSPEAMEEAIWMRFFPDLHDPARSNVLDAATANPGFERFYREHVRKILLIRQARRYVAKGNYNVTRIAYLHRLFPDARFLVPVRDPVHHVASLMKQHRLFEEAERRDRRILAHMRRVGHFEFGLDRRPINTGRPGATARVRALWESGEAVRGWAAYWADVYAHVRETVQASAGLDGAVRIVRYHELCRESVAVLTEVFDHCGLAPQPDDIAEAAARLSPPGYYAPAFTEAERAAIAEETAEVADWFGVHDAGA